MNFDYSSSMIDWSVSDEHKSIKTYDFIYGLFERNEAILGISCISVMSRTLQGDSSSASVLTKIDLAS